MARPKLARRSSFYQGAIPSNTDHSMLGACHSFPWDRWHDGVRLCTGFKLVTPGHARVGRGQCNAWMGQHWSLRHREASHVRVQLFDCNWIELYQWQRVRECKLVVVGQYIGGESIPRRKPVDSPCVDERGHCTPRQRFVSTLDGLNIHVCPALVREKTEKHPRVSERSLNLNEKWRWRTAGRSTFIQVHTCTYRYTKGSTTDRHTVYIIQKCALYTCVYAFVFLVHVPRYHTGTSTCKKFAVARNPCCYCTHVRVCVATCTYKFHVLVSIHVYYIHVCVYVHEITF